MSSLFTPLGVLIVTSLVTLSGISLHLFSLQLLWVGIGVGVVIFFLFVDWRSLLGYRWFIGGLYILSIVLLFAVYVKGPVIRNIRSWIVVGPVNFQPVELAKVALILLYASYFSRRHLGVARWSTIVTSFAFFLAPAVLTALQPELGSVLILFGIWFGFLLLSGLPLGRVFVTFLIFLVAAFLVWAYVLRDYHRARIVGFFYPERDVLGINYSVIQSKIAVGSAGFWGKGYRQGSQAQLGFLPEPASDFVFAAFIEEWGMLGGLIVVAAFLWLIADILKIGVSADRNFEKFVCLGTVMVLGLQFLLNAGSSLGLIPVVGVTFPFLSYGGSSLFVNFFLVAIINAIAHRS